MFKFIVQRNEHQFCYQQTRTAGNDFEDGQINWSQQEFESTKSIQIDYSQL